MEQMHIAHSEALYDRAKELMSIRRCGRFSLWAVRRGLFSVPKTSTSTMRTATSISIISAPGDR